MSRISDGINRFFYGDGTDENPGVFKKYLSGVKDFLVTEIWTPLTNLIQKDWNRIKTFFAEEMIKPLRNTLQPFIDEGAIHLHGNQGLVHWTHSPIQSRIP